MKIEIRADKVILDGYVNAVERVSKPLYSRFGEFIEKICAGAFGRAIQRNDDIRILLNHDWDKDLGGTGTGEIELTEDTIGLRAHAEITDAQVISDARAGKLVGWSFGFRDRAVDILQDNETGLPLRSVKDLDLYEVSILNSDKTPAYNGTSVSVRSAEGDDIQLNVSDTYKPDNIETIEEVRAEDITGGTVPAETRAEDETQPEANNNDTKSYDNSKYINIVAELKTIRDSVQ